MCEQSIPVLFGALDFINTAYQLSFRACTAVTGAAALMAVLGGSRGVGARRSGGYDAPSSRSDPRLDA